MSEESKKPEQQKLEGGAYEVIRNRLNTQGQDLLSRVKKLNAARKAVFGAIEPKLLATERVQTENNCIPRGMIALPGGRFIFGYNVHIGLKSHVDITDVFSKFRYDSADHSFHEEPMVALLTREFVDDFQYLYKYYKKTFFAKFMLVGPHLQMVFQIGEDLRDIKVFKWLLKDDGSLEYLGNRFEHEYKYPDQHSFQWTRAHRELQRSGTHPHISLDDRLFVETTGGDLTIKVEDNTDSGEGIYSEPVDNTDQTLDDAEIHYAAVGSLIFVKIKPYQEKATRYFIYNEKVKEVKRVDSIGHSCVLLPEDHGVIFADGYYLHNGSFKRFGEQKEAMTFERIIKAPNGEDYLYVFYQQKHGTYQLMPYNLISQKVGNPIEAHGYTIFENGSLAYFKANDEPIKSHALQIWQTPFAAEEQVIDTETDSYLFKIGNASIVRAVAECNTIYNLIQREDSYEGLYLDIVRQCTATIDSYFWIGSEESGNLRQTLEEIRQTGQSAIGEFEKVQRIQKATLNQTNETKAKARSLFTTLEGAQPEDVRGFVELLSELRTLRGEVIGLRDLRYVNLTLCDDLEAKIAERIEKLAQSTVEFLLKDEALDPFRKALADNEASIEKIATAAEAKQTLEELDESGSQLEMLIETVSNLKINDATQTTRIIDGISSLFTELNRLKAEVRKKRQELMRQEGSAQFHAQIKLLEQSVANYLDIADVPERCDEYLTKAIVQLEELEGNYAEFDEFIDVLADKRSELYNAFETKKAGLQEARNRRVTKLIQSADRILKGIENRSRSFKEVNAINGYFASDLMVDKVRDVVRELKDLNESIKGDELLTRLKTIQGDAIRQLKDKNELFVDGENLIQFGKHKFTVNTQTLELTSVLRDEELYYHLSGTQFFERIDDSELLKTRAVWKMQTPSENDNVYRAEYLAYQFLKASDHKAYLAMEEEARLEALRKFMAPRYDEAYTKGLHDLDAAKILDTLMLTHESVGLLRYHPKARACGLVFWQSGSGKSLSARLRERINAFGAMLKAFPEHHTQRDYIAELADAIAQFCRETKLFPESISQQAAEYIFYEIVLDEDFYSTREAAGICDAFHREILAKRFLESFEQAIKEVEEDAVAVFRITMDWLEGYAATFKLSAELKAFLPEAAAHMLNGGVKRLKILDVTLTGDIENLKGTHSIVQEGGKYHFNYLEFMERMRCFELEDSKMFIDFQRRRKSLIETTATALRLDEFKPRVLSAFVRNKLLDKVYLPLIGDNLAKQIGSAGEDTRTDRMGLLLLISPPGYGKTTLMEYIANRLGITFVKVNGPSLGHDVTSLDPGQCANTAARQEVEKINLAFEMGDNVLIYLDDIQHTNPELLQKFISLCDGTRRIEGVYKGKSRTYDLRGRKVAVVMAGNPYTETGGKFQIPDMLANRADTYNLGDIIGENSNDFKASYIENSLTSNKTLSNLAGKSRKDVYAVMQIAETGQREGVDFESSFSMEEINEMVSVMQKMMRVRDTILRVNLEYVRSAAQADDYRTEPPFKLQGSYRNMNRIAEKLLPIMTDQEVEQIIDDHYTGEAQTLTDGAEANLLKFKELEGKLTKEDSERWTEIKKRFNRKKVMGGDDTDPVNKIVSQLADFRIGLSELGDTLTRGGTDTQTAIQQAIALLADAVHSQSTENVSSNKHLAETLDAVSKSVIKASNTEKQKSAETTQALATAFEQLGKALAEAQESQSVTTSKVATSMVEQLATIAQKLDAVAESGAQSTTRNEQLEEILATLSRSETEQTKAIQAWAENITSDDNNDAIPEPLPPSTTTGSLGAIKLDAHTETLLQSILIAFRQLFKQINAGTKDGD